MRILKDIVEQNSSKLQNLLKRGGLLLLLGTLTAIAPISTDIYLPSFPFITEEFKTIPSKTQLSLTAGLIGLAFGQLFFGPISDIYGRKKPLMIAMIIYAIASFLCGIATSIWMFIFFRLLQGLAGAGGVVIARACVRDLYSGSELTRIYAIMMLVVGIAPIVAPVIGGQLLLVIPWNGIFIILSILGVVLLAAVFFVLSETLGKEKRLKGGLKNTFTTFFSLIRHRIFIGYALTQGLIFASMFAYISGSSFVYQDFFGVSPQVYSFLFGLNAIGLMTATQITGRLAGKIVESKLLVFGLGYALVGGLSLLISILTDAGIVPVAISLFISISAVGIVSTTCFTLAMESQGGKAGSASALLGLMQFTIGGLIAPIVGIAGSKTALPMGIAIVLCETLAIIFYITLVHRGKAHHIDVEKEKLSI